MPDLQKALQEKEKILNVIKSSGPSFPQRISRETGIQPLFAAAFLSELVAERKLKMSSMKVGSSPIYLMPGQETQLEKFSEFLGQKEKEAFFLLKDQKILQDEKQDPAIRVAIRKLKDFATPINVKMDEKVMLFWKFFTLSDTETRELIQDTLEIERPKKQEPKEEIKRQEPAIERPIERKHEKQIEPIFQERPKKQAIKKKSFAFAEKIKSFLNKKDIEVIEDVAEKNKEYTARIRRDTEFGKQEYLLTAKDKKKVTEDDLSVAIHKAQAIKMPALFLASGTLDKTAEEYLKSWSNIIKFQKI